MQICFQALFGEELLSLSMYQYRCKFVGNGSNLGIGVVGAFDGRQSCRCSRELATLITGCEPSCLNCYSNPRRLTRKCVKLTYLLSFCATTSLFAMSCSLHLLSSYGGVGVWWFISSFNTTDTSRHNIQRYILQKTLADFSSKPFFSNNLAPKNVGISRHGPKLPLKDP